MPTIAEALALGLQYHRAGQLERAGQVYRQILQTQPDHAEALHRLAVVSLHGGRLDESLQLFARAIAIDPNVAEYYNNFGTAYLAAGRPAEAARALAEAISRGPGSTDAHYNLGLALYDLGRLDDAAASYRTAVALCPSNASAHTNLGDLLREQGRLDEALAHLDRAVALDPQMPAAHYNRSLAWLSQGRLREGWAEYEWRLRSPALKRRQFALPRWDGSFLAEKSLLIHAEQGFGDTLQFIRYLPLVHQRCRNVTVEVPPGLLPILEQSGFPGLTSERSSAGHFDFQLPMLSLPAVFQTTLDTIPGGVPYLSAKPQLVERWQRELSEFSGFKVAVVWQGRASYREDRYRSMALSHFAPLAAVRGVRLISLQKGSGSEQISLVQDRFRVVDLGSRLDEQSGSFMDTAAIMKNVDLVVTSDTAAAHLAGALGVRVWVALRFAPDWRWLTARPDSPWYPTMRLFRQTRFGDWSTVFRSMADELARLI